MRKITIFFAFMCFFITSNAFSEDWDITQLTNNGYSDWYAEIDNNGFVAWSGKSGADENIYYYDSQGVHQLTNSHDNYAPRVDDGQIAWRSSINGNTQVFLYDDSIKQLTNTIDSTNWPQDIDNGQVTWCRLGSPVSENNGVFLRDGNNTTQIASGSNSFNDGSNVISNGQVVWRNLGGSVYLYNGVNASPIPDSSGGSYPIIDNGKVAWYNNSQVFMYDGIQTKQLSTDNRTINTIGISNGEMFWMSSDVNGNNAIYFYDGTENKKIADIMIDVNSPWSVPLPQINNGNVVWSSYDGSDYEVFLYDGANITQLTNNTVGDFRPTLNAMGDVVWHGFDGNDYEIYKASVVPEPISMLLFGLGGLTMAAFKCRKKA